MTTKRRNTPSKQAVLDVLRSAGEALSREKIEQELKGVMDRVTVYRVLNRFCEDGYVHRVLSDDGKNYFAMCVNCEASHHRHDHFHFRCMTCLKVECLNEEINVRIPPGYRLESMNCLITGYCKTCS